MRIFCWCIISHSSTTCNTHITFKICLTWMMFTNTWLAMLCNQINLFVKFTFDSLTWFCCNHNPEIFTFHFVAYLCCGSEGCCGQWWNVRTIGSLCYYYALTLTHHHAAQRGNNYLVPTVTATVSYSIVRKDYGQDWWWGGFVVLLHISLWSVATSSQVSLL